MAAVNINLTVNGVARPTAPKILVAATLADAVAGIASGTTVLQVADLESALWTATNPGAAVRIPVVVMPHKGILTIG